MDAEEPEFTEKVQPLTIQVPLGQFENQDEVRLAEEAELVRRVSQGDSVALVKLYENYLDPIYRYIFSWVHNVYEAQTLTSETFTRAIEALSRGRYTWQNKSFGVFLNGIATKIHLERSRKLKNAPATEELDQALESHELVSQEPDVLDALVQKEEQAALWQLIKELAVEEQRVLIMRHVYDLPYADIAQLLGRSESACKQLHYRVLRKLKLKAQETDLWTEVTKGKFGGRREHT
jgi:RNA polymerase sigma-70 factor, ECF subfamily